MADQEDDLRATTEDIAADAEELEAIEAEKARLNADDPRLEGLSRKGERIVRGLVSKTAAERELVDETTGAGGRDEDDRTN